MCSYCESEDTWKLRERLQVAREQNETLRARIAELERLIKAYEAMLKPHYE